MSRILTRRANRSKWNFRRNWVLYLMLAPMVVLLFVFSYMPMYGIVIAFQDYSPIKGFFHSKFVGLKWFRVFFDNPDSWQIIFNTLYISILKLVFGTVFTIAFAVMMNEISNMKFRKIIQTTVCFPNFLSWVVVGGMFISILSINGPINNLINALGLKPIGFFENSTLFPFTLMFTDVWKGFGWGSILYLAAFANINPELYEAAIIDGASRWKRIWYVTLPGIRPTIVLLLTLSLGNILNAGFEQVLMMYNPLVYSTGDIIDTYVYRAGLNGGQFSLGAAVGLLKSAVGAVLIITSNKLAYKFAGYRIF